MNVDDFKHTLEVNQSSVSSDNYVKFLLDKDFPTFMTICKNVFPKQINRDNIHKGVVGIFKQRILNNLLARVKKIIGRKDVLEAISKIYNMENMPIQLIASAGMDYLLTPDYVINTLWKSKEWLLLTTIISSPYGDAAFPKPKLHFSEAECITPPSSLKHLEGIFDNNRFVHHAESCIIPAMCYNEFVFKKIADIGFSRLWLITFILKSTNSSLLTPWIVEYLNYGESKNGVDSTPVHVFKSMYAELRKADKYEDADEESKAYCNMTASVVKYQNIVITNMLSNNSSSSLIQTNINDAFANIEYVPTHAEQNKSIAAKMKSGKGDIETLLSVLNDIKKKHQTCTEKVRNDFVFSMLIDGIEEIVGVEKQTIETLTIDLIPLIKELYEAWVYWETYFAYFKLDEWM